MGANEKIEASWRRHAVALAAWAEKNLVNRRDAFGHYIAKELRNDPDRTAITEKAELTLAVLQRHFEAKSTGDLIGLHSTARDEAAGPGEVASCWSRWLAIDIDRHDDSTDAEATERAAKELAGRAAGFGFSALLLDSNGGGGFHLLIVFSAPVTTAKVYALGKWLVRDWRKLGLDSEPETFPKQPSIPAGGFGNWLRLPGRHHTRDHRTRVWDGSAWLEGARAIKAIVQSKANGADLIPAEALAPPKIKRKSKVEPKPEDFGKDADLASQALRYLDPSMPYPDWLNVGMALTQLEREGLDLWDRWSSDSEKYQEGLCDRKWRSFRRGGIALGTLFHLAKARGFEFPRSGSVYGERRKNYRLGATGTDGLTVGAGAAPPGSGGTQSGGGGGTERPSGPDLRAGWHPDSDPDDGEQGPPQFKRADIEVNTDRFRVVEESITALTADPNLYSRGVELVGVVQEDANLIHLTTRTVMEKVAGTPKIVTLSDAVIGDRLTRYAAFYQWKKDRNGEFYDSPAHPPDWLIKTIATQKVWPGIRYLASVAECPFPRPDGSIVETPGYDARTCILYSPSIEFPAIPDRPSRDDARAAWDRIKRYVRHFPFATEDDLAVFLAGMLSVIARPGIVGPMPGIAVNGNKAGIGKGYLVDGMVIPGTGRVAPMSKYPHDPIEAGKVKTSIVRSGKTVVSFDNLHEGAKYGGEDVDSLITAKITDDRVLGVSENTGDLVVRLTCFVNGNNIEPVKDAYRRWLVCNLVTDLDHPERRDDIRDEDGNPERDLDVQMLEDRAAIVGDALTILRAHSVAGRPKGPWSPIGSFGHWEEVVRGAVWFATGRDCVATQYQAAEESTDRLEKVALLQGLWELPGAKQGQSGVTSAEACKIVEDTPSGYQTLRNALLAKGQNGKPADSKRLGPILRGMANTPIGGFKLTKSPDLKHGAVAWRVERLETNPGEVGEVGEDVSNPRTRSSGIGNYANTYAKERETRRGPDRTGSPSSPTSPPPDSCDDIDWGEVPASPSAGDASEVGLEDYPRYLDAERKRSEPRDTSYGRPGIPPGNLSGWD